MEFNELMTADISALSVEQQDFIDLHNAIMSHGNAAYASSVQMARGLKEMRDTKKYKAAGFETFGEYAENACGIKERQAYNYITFVEKLSPSFLHSNAKIGVTKLITLASMEEEDREKLIADHGKELDELSIRALNELKKEYENRLTEAQREYEERLKEKENEIEDFRRSEEDTPAAALEESEREKARLKAEIEALKSATSKETSDALEKKKREVDRLKQEKEAAQRQLAEEKERAEKELAAAVAQERAAAEATKKELERERARIEAEAKKTKIAADPFVSEFKAQFTLWQNMGNSLLSLVAKMGEENAAKCAKAFNAVLGGWKK